MTELSLLNEQLSALLTNEHSAIANLANASALINESVDNLNWAGFYLYNSKNEDVYKRQIKNDSKASKANGAPKMSPMNRE